jgi:lysophospholipase L1-like esterase
VRRRLSTAAVVGALWIFAPACSPSEGNGDSGADPSSATGGEGATSSGGSGSGGVATGGLTGSGGVATGGLTGSGGTATGGNGSGGSSGSGGAATGGASGAGGKSGAGGMAGHAGTGGAAGTTGGGGHPSAGSGAGGAGGGAGAGVYNPCSAHSAPCKILPLGDSITYGVNDEGNGGYRGPLFASVVAAAQKITFTGSLSNGPNTVSGQTFPKQNEGHSGWGISEVTTYSNGNAGIATVIPTPALSASSGGTPDIILLHIGTNDSGQYPATQMTSDLQGLLNKIFSNAPNALVVVAQIIPLGYGTNSVIKAYNQSIPGLVQTFAAAGKHITTVDMYTGFNTSTMLGSDSIHPNTSGYTFMSQHWYSVIGSLLPK